MTDDRAIGFEEVGFAQDQTCSTCGGTIPGREPAFRGRDAETGETLAILCPPCFGEMKDRLGPGIPTHDGEIIH